MIFSGDLEVLLEENIYNMLLHNILGSTEQYILIYKLVVNRKK